MVEAIRAKKGGGVVFTTPDTLEDPATVRLFSVCSLHYQFAVCTNICLGWFQVWEFSFVSHDGRRRVLDAVASQWSNLFKVDLAVEYSTR